MSEPNILGTKPEGALLRQFAIPSIIAMLVGSLYNIVDQFFIGNTVGELGNAATNITFPFSISCIALALMFGIGGASAFNLSMGEGEPDRAKHYIGNCVTLSIASGLILTIIVLLFTKPLLIAFGSPDEVLPYALTYARITAFGFPFLILSAGGAHILRADGNPRMTMVVNITGAGINTILDAIFVFVLGWGIAGAAIATVIGQAISASIVLGYLPRFRTVPLTRDTFVPNTESVGRIVSLGMAPFFNQMSLMIVQVVTNNLYKHYGAASIYGESIPIAVAGIGTKIFHVAGSFVIGISQGLQPIASFNYGARQYDRVKKSYMIAIKSAAVICIIFCVLFQAFPDKLIGIFGNGTDLYVEFGVKYVRICLFLICIFFMQPITSNFFTAIGMPKKGVFLSLTRQIIFLLPLLFILPLFFGIDGLLYSIPIADFSAALVCLVMIIHEMKKEKYQQSSWYGPEDD